MADENDVANTTEELMLDEGISIEEPAIEEAVDEPEAPKPLEEPSEVKAVEEPASVPKNEGPTVEELTVDGYTFLSKEDVEKAKLDRQKINILGQKVKSTKVADLEAVYEKAISNRIFSTPIGWEYLAKLRNRLISAGVSEDDLTPIPITVKFTNVALPDEYHPRQYITPLPKKKRDLKTSVFLMGVFNVILVVLVILMFLIAWLGETDNILNYKRNVTNRFAEWEQSLKEREKAVRIKERDLMIEDDTPFGEGIDLDETEDSEQTDTEQTDTEQN